MTETGSTLPRRQLGRILREARENTGMPIDTAAELAELSPSGLQRLEKGQGARRVKLRDIAELCRIYEMDDDTEAACKGLAQQATEPSWWHEYGDLIPANFDVYVGLESAARSLTCYAPDIVLGLLQTLEYARALVRSAAPAETDTQIGQRAQLKHKRQALIKRKTRPADLHVILLECALRRVVGNHTVMAAQLAHLADVSTWPNVALRVLPFEAGIPLGDPMGPFTVLDFGTDAKGRATQPSIVYLENFVGDLYLEKSRDVERYDVAHQAIRRAALDDTESRSLIRQIAKEYAT